MSQPHQHTYEDWEKNPDPPHQPMLLGPVMRYLRGGGPSVRRVLDAGCGNGNFTASIAGAGYEVYGIDLSESGISIARVKNGKLVEGWNSFDQLGMLQQLGVVAAPA